MRPVDPALTLTLLTVNVNGLGSAGRAQKLLSYQQRVAGRPEVTMVQEVKLLDTTAVREALRHGSGPGQPWAGEVAYSPGTARSCGTAILARGSLPLPGCTRQAAAKDGAGRITCWDWDVAHVRLRLLCVYAPAQGAARSAFFASELRPYLETDRHLLIGGDFNCVLSPADEMLRGVGRAQGAAALRAVMEECGLVDPWVSLRGRGGFTQQRLAGS
jgi:exonuclease III